MDFEQIRQYWENRAAADPSAQSTTQDYYLREIESRVLCELMLRQRPRRVMDVGCGDARTTIRLATAFPEIDFLASDYAVSMIRIAEANMAAARLQNLRVQLHDVTKALPGRNFDLIYTTRCLINLPDWELQGVAINHIHEALGTDGVYVMIENFVEGHLNFNRIREVFGLSPIPVRSHNLYFERSRLLKFLGPSFETVEELNISSTYYLVSRIIYSRICQDRAAQPDYFDEHHRYASGLPFCGEYGPVRMLCLKKR